jgi:beta-glucosidase
MKHTQNSQPRLSFPKKFFWGAATAAHQVEGGTHNQWSVWELENAATRAQEAKYELKDLPIWEDIEAEATKPANYTSGKAADHYRLYEDDFDLLTTMHMNAFRFSIEWSRIEPKEGEWDSLAIEHYRLYLHALQRRGIEPMVTLWHWTMPEWFTDMGGFENRRNIKYFVRFAQKVFEELGSEFRYVITINEPEVYMAQSYIEARWPPMRDSKWQALKVYYHLAIAHKRVYKVAKQINRKFLVGLSKNVAHTYAGDDALLSKISARIAIYGADYFFLNRVKRKLDFIGLNYYFTNRFYGSRVHNEDLRVNDLGWDMQPQNIEFVLRRLYEKYNLPIIITENGLADRHDKYRKWWLMETIVAMQRAMDKGVKLEGYLHWSLLDNFEWAEGFWPRFGLAEVDYATQTRTLRPSAKWFASTIKKLRS